MHLSLLHLEIMENYNGFDGFEELLWRFITEDGYVYVNLFTQIYQQHYTL